MMKIVLVCLQSFFFFFNDTATTEIYTLSLHDALPIRVTSTIASTSANAPIASAARPVQVVSARRPRAQIVGRGAGIAVGGGAITAGGSCAGLDGALALVPSLQRGITPASNALTSVQRVQCSNSGMASISSVLRSISEERSVTR